MTEFLLTRDRTCRAPGCAVRAVAADLDHTQEYACGGVTAPWNLMAFCRSHHTTKTAGRTDITHTADGSATYTTVLGQRIPIPPRRVLPDDSPAA